MHNLQVKIKTNYAEGFSVDRRTNLTAFEDYCKLNGQKFYRFFSANCKLLTLWRKAALLNAALLKASR